MARPAVSPCDETRGAVEGAETRGDALPGYGEGHPQPAPRNARELRKNLTAAERNLWLQRHNCGKLKPTDFTASILRGSHR